MGEFVKILMVILISSVKFVVGPAFAYYDEKYDFTIFEAIVYPIIGGMLGVFVFSFFTFSANSKISFRLIQKAGEKTPALPNISGYFKTA